MMSDELTETDPRASGKIYKIYEISRSRRTEKIVDKNVKNFECSKIISTFAVDIAPIVFRGIVYFILRKTAR